MPSAMGRGIESALQDLDLTEHMPLPADESIPTDPVAFYSDFGYLKHPRTRRPVTELAGYQLDTWKGLHEYKRVYCLKSNKAGISTSTLIADFQLAILPNSHPLSCRGFDILVIAQSLPHAAEHLRTLRKLILGSTKYRPFLISKPDEVTLRDEVTKINTIYLKNPDNPSQPTRILGLSLNNAGSLASWKNVRHLHFSDPTQAEGDISEGINMAFTRLANSDGSCIIETVPGQPQGRMFELYKQYESQPWKPGAFKIYTIPASEAVKAGVISAEFLEGEKSRLGVMYPQFYEALFMAGAGNIFPALFVDLCSQNYDMEMKDGTKVLAVDPAFGSSKFAILGAEKVKDTIYVREARQFDRPSPSAMLDVVAGLYHRDHYSSCLVDSAHPGLITDLNNGSEKTGRKPVYAQSVNFREKLSEMTMAAAQAVKEQNVRIHPAFTELNTQLKSVQFNDQGHPDKKRLSFDIGDAFLMAVHYLIKGSGEVGIAILPEDGFEGDMGEFLVYNESRKAGVRLV